MTRPRPKAQLNDRILRLEAVIEFSGLSETVIEDLVKRGRFPNAVRISDRAKGWLWSELRAWLDQRIRERDSAP
jgi:prophage regulatory protein